jgi:hypothetical protein
MNLASLPSAGGARERPPSWFHQSSGSNRLGGLVFLRTIYGTNVALTTTPAINDDIFYAHRRTTHTGGPHVPQVPLCHPPGPMPPSAAGRLTKLVDPRRPSLPIGASPTNARRLAHQAGTLATRQTAGLMDAQPGSGQPSR